MVNPPGSSPHLDRSLPSPCIPAAFSPPPSPERDRGWASLSVLIPVLDSDASALVGEMLDLADSEGIDAEIIVGDDASTSHLEWMETVASLPWVRVLHNAENQGRARNRNHMAEAAHGEWLLMIDADARLLPEFSLRRYLEAGKTAPVVCGGLRTPSPSLSLPTGELPNCKLPGCSLRYSYERDADLRRSPQLRQQHPYDQLSTFNLLVRRDIFLSIRFDDTLTQYGYEDALFGIELKHRAVAIAHIDNPLLHTGMDTNEEFLAKTEVAMHNLARLAPRMAGHSRLVDAAMRCRRLHVAPLLRLLFAAVRTPMRRNLLSSRPSLTVFNLYKLGTLLRAMRE